MAVIISVGPKLEIKTLEYLLFLHQLNYLLFSFDFIKILFAKQLKPKMTPTNILKIKENYQYCFNDFWSFLIVQGLFPKEKEKLKDNLERIDNVGE